MRKIPVIRWPGLVPGTFLERPNRFLVIARVHGRRVRAACRDPGRFELLVPGARLLVAPSRDARRRTAFTVVLVRHGRRWISAVPGLANRLLEAALARGAAAGLEGARILGREVARGGSRLDFLLGRRGSRLLTEVKSATLVEGGRALFPDAPTARGVRHLRELIAARRRGERSMIVFVVQRGDARSLSPHRERDPVFARTLGDAARAGVRLLAYRCRISPRRCAIGDRIPVVLTDGRRARRSGRPGPDGARLAGRR